MIIRIPVAKLRRMQEFFQEFEPSTHVRVHQMFSPNVFGRINHQPTTTSDVSKVYQNFHYFPIMLQARNLIRVRSMMVSHRGIGSTATVPGLTKIVATIGPKSEQLPMLSQLVTAGVRIMRINFSHATYEEADLRVKNLRLSRGMNSATNLRAVLLDTQGPEIRTGMFADVKEVELKTGQQIVLTIDDSLKEKQSSDKIWISYKKLLDTVKEGSLILLDDGAIEVKVVKKNVAGGEITCTVLNSGMLGNKKGVNMPGLSVELPAMSAKDMEDIHW